MTDALIVAVAALGVLTCLNLLLTYGLVRRVSEHDRQLAHRESGLPASKGEPAPGTPISAFTATTVDGRALTEQSFAAGLAYVGFFSVACPPCHEQLPRFVNAVLPLDGTRVLIVVVDDSPEANRLDSFVAGARGAGQVVVEGPMGPVATAFGVRKLPTMVVIDDGVVTTSGHVADQLPVPVQM
jgi:hypothetical protein